MSEDVLLHNRTAGRKTLHYKKLLLPAWFCSRAGLRSGATWDSRRHGRGKHRPSSVGQ